MKYLKISTVLISLFIFGQSQAQHGHWNYTVTNETSSPISMSGATVIGLGADDVTVSTMWPFNGGVYSDYYTTSDSMHINSNGIMRFDKSLWPGAGTPGTYPTFPTNSTTFGQCISYGGNSDGHIAGNIMQKVTGSIGNRIITFAFTYYTHYSNTGSFHADIQISIYELNRKIRIDYSNVGGTTTPALHLGINAGDSVWGADFAPSFPIVAIAYVFNPSPIPSVDPSNANNNLSINVMPNPSSDIFNIEIENTNPGNMDIAVYNALGQNILSKTLLNNSDLLTSFKLDLSNHAKGIYYLRVQSKNNMTIRKLILQ